MASQLPEDWLLAQCWCFCWCLCCCWSDVLSPCPSPKSWPLSYQSTCHLSSTGAAVGGSTAAGLSPLLQNQGAGLPTASALVACQVMVMLLVSLLELVESHSPDPRGQPLSCHSTCCLSRTGAAVGVSICCWFGFQCSASKQLVLPVTRATVIYNLLVVLLVSLLLLV